MPEQRPTCDAFRVIRSGPVRSAFRDGTHEQWQGRSRIGIDHRLTPPKFPRTNGIAEREGGRIGAVLQAVVSNRVRHWSPRSTALCPVLQPAAPPIGPGKQNAIADDEKPAQTQTGIVPETILSLFGMGQVVYFANNTARVDLSSTGFVTEIAVVNILNVYKPCRVGDTINLSSSSIDISDIPNNCDGSRGGCVRREYPDSINRRFGGFYSSILSNSADEAISFITSA